MESSTAYTVEEDVLYTQKIISKIKASTEQCEDDISMHKKKGEYIHDRMIKYRVCPGRHKKLVTLATPSR